MILLLILPHIFQLKFDCHLSNNCINLELPLCYSCFFIYLFFSSSFITIIVVLSFKTQKSLFIQQSCRSSCLSLLMSPCPSRLTLFVSLSLCPHPVIFLFFFSCCLSHKQKARQLSPPCLSLPMLLISSCLSSCRSSSHPSLLVSFICSCVCVSLSK